jgi:hypothetical protein
MAHRNIILAYDMTPAYGCVTAMALINLSALAIIFFCQRKAAKRKRNQLMSRTRQLQLMNSPRVLKKNNANVKEVDGSI